MKGLFLCDTIALVFRRPAIRLLTSVVFAASMWFYLDHVLVPHQVAEATQTGRPRGSLSDLYPRWLGARELLLHQRDPYSAGVTREIQIGYYGRPLDPSRANDPKDQQAFAYPVFVVFYLAPTVSLPFDVVRPAFTWLLMLLTALSVPIWLRVVNWRIHWHDELVLVILVLGSFQFAQGLKLQQLSLLVAAITAVAAGLARAGNLLTAGLFLALALIKPQLSLPMTAWMLLWAIGDLRRRWRLVAGFVSVGAVLLIGSELILPGWLGKFFRAWLAYRDYTSGAQTLLELLAGPSMGKILGVALVLLCGWVCWHARRATSSSDDFALVASLVLAATVILIPMVAPYNQLLLVPGCFFLANSWRKVWNSGPPLRAGVVITLLVVVWPWVAAFLLSVGLALLPRALVLRAWVLPLHSTLILPICIAAMLFLFLRAQRSEASPGLSR